MNEHPTNHVDGPPSTDERISYDRRILFDIGFAGKEGFESVLAVAHSLEGSSPDSRRSALFASCDQLEGLIPVIQEMTGVLRNMAGLGVFPLEARRKGGPVLRALSRLRLWVITR